MKKENCSKFHTCSAPLCILDYHPQRYWYTDTEICQRASVPEWVRAQRRIAKLNPSAHQYYTQKMLENIKRVTTGISGIEAVGYNKALEHEWIALRANGQSSKKAS